MKTIRTILGIGLLPVALAWLAPISANPSRADDPASRLINTPTVFKAWGTSATWRRDPAVQGGGALRIATTGQEKNLYDVGVYSPIDKPVKTGDKLVLAFWARVERTADGNDRATLPHNAIQHAAPPFTPVVNGSAVLSPNWELHKIAGRADRDYAAGELAVGIQLAAGKQTIDMGPVFVYDFGQ